MTSSHAKAKAGQTAYNPPGGIYYERSPLARIASYAKPRGAVFHAIAGSFDIPFYSVQCLVNGVHKGNGTVSFDHKIGCDQGATWNAGADELQWYIENVKEECDSPGEYVGRNKQTPLATKNLLEDTDGLHRPP